MAKCPIVPGQTQNHHRAPMTTVSLDTLNSCDPAAFVRALGDVFEHSPWVAERAAAKRPFQTVEALHAAMFDEIASAPALAKREFVSRHPELAGKAASTADMAPDSISEQGSAGLDRLSPDALAHFTRLNEIYQARFGFPFVICVRRHTRASILAEFERRAGNDPADELETALREIYYITRLRLDGRVGGPGKPQVHGHLSTHVLDTAAGRPAAGVGVELRDISDGLPGTLIKSEMTDADGRTETPLIGGQPLRIGRYELTFHVAAYFRARGVKLADPPFLDQIPLQFAIAEPEGDYHVPLLVTPWSYSTYRGS
jgi:2-oxo-4-hydroxy-4-carboxy-5-ureidoimidazoline decarboxylase